MRRLIFKSFLSDEIIYNQNRKFWSDIIIKAQPNSSEWMKNEFKNGVKILDGNPLISYKYKNLAIRIIQIEVDETIPKLMIWEKNYDEININEIVIHIQPFLEVYNDVVPFIKLYFNNRFKRSQIRLNRKYYNEFSNKRRRYMISVLKKLENEKSPLIQEKRISPTQAKIIRTAAKNLPILKARGENAKIVREYNKTVKLIYSLSKIASKSLTNSEIQKVKVELEEIKEGLEEK